MNKIFFFLFLILTFQGCEVDGNPEMLELLIEIRNQNNELKEEILKLQENIEQLLFDVNKGNETNDLLKNQVDALTANLEKVLNELEALNEKSEEDGANIEKILKELEKLQEKYLVILSQLELLQELQVLIGELEILKGQVSQLQEQSSSMLESITEFNASLKNLEENISAVNSKISQALEKITALTEQLSKQEGNLDTILTELNKLKIEVEELKEFLNQLLNAPKIGDFYKGGIVFYIDDSSLNGLVVAKTNQRDGATGWGCYCQFIEGIESGLGTGKSNTEKILNQCEASQGIAADIVDQLILEGFEDWYLPSKDELDLVYEVLHLNGLGDFPTEIPYWTSTQTEYGSCGIGGGAWVKDFKTGQNIKEYKNGYQENGAIRAIRSF